MMMNEFDKSRKNELLELVSHHELQNVLPDDINIIVEFENEMTNNKNMLIELNENEIIGDLELESKIAKCFDIFLKKVVSKFGDLFCKSIYDYLPGEELGFIKGYEKNQVMVDALEISNASSSLRDMMSKHKELADEERYFPMFELVAHTSDTSNALMASINKEREMIAEIKEFLQKDINIINEHMIPIVSINSPDTIHNVASFSDFSDSLNTIRTHLTFVTDKFNKLSKLEK
jgi:hypothetical protein